MSNESAVDFEMIDKGLKSGNAVPLSWYYDADISDYETAMFERAWQYAGHIGQLSEPGQFVTFTVGRVPMIVVRNRQGELRAFRNVCRHRSAEVVVEPCGTRRMLQCHYHAWTYDLDGRLVGAPRSDREAEFDKTELSLIPASVDTWGPFVFVNLDVECSSLEEALGDVPDLIRAAGVDVDTLVFNRRSEYDMDCNWKISIENYLECYHCPGAHPGFSRVLDTNADAYRISAEKTHAHQIAPLRPSPATVDTGGYTGRDGVVNSGTYIVVWPSLTINVNPGLQNLSIGPMLPVPGAINKSHAYLDYFFGAEVTEEWIDDMFVFDNRVAEEDQELIESVQRGVDSRTLETAQVLPTSESLLLGFQRYLVDQHKNTDTRNGR